MQRNFPEQGHLDIAITRTDGVPVSGWGVIGDLLIIIEDNIFEPPLTPETIKTPLYITGLCSINANETTKWTNGAPLELVIQRENSASSEANNPDQAVLLYPNPAAALVHISSKTGTVKQVEISDLSGRVFTSLASDKNDLDVSVAQLPVGTYLVRVLTAEGLVMRKLSVMR